MAFILRDHRDERLKKFVETNVKPTAAETSSLKEDVNQFASFLKEHFEYKSFTIAEVFKSGSLGRGTATKNSDIDLVVIFNGIRDLHHFVHVRPELLENLERQIKRYNNWDGNVSEKKSTKFSVSYIYRKSNGDVHEIDILPAMNLRCMDRSPGTLFKEIGFTDPLTIKGRSRRNERGQEYSASLAPLQRAFVRDFFRSIRPSGQHSAEEIVENIKDTVRLLKYWKQEIKIDVRSYTLELLTVHAYENTHEADIRKLFKEVLKLLRRCPSLTVAFDTNYKSVDYTSYREPPYVLDPANPFLNTLDGTNTEQVQSAATQTLMHE